MILEPGQEIEVGISSLNHRGEGVGRHDGVAVFIPLTGPGDRIRARITEVKKGYARAELISVVEGGVARCEPGCVLFESCGGCSLQHMDYESQRRHKTDLVRQSLIRIGKLPDVKVHETMGMESPWHYRNKIHFQVGREGSRLVLGFFAGESHRLVPLSGADKNMSCGCLLVDQALIQLALRVEKILNRYNVNIYDWAREEGLLRHVLLKRAQTGQMMVVFITSNQKWPGQHDLAAELALETPGLTSVQRHIREGKDRQVMGGRNVVLYGAKYIIDKIGELKFQVSPESFYQVNPGQTQVLYKKALEISGLTGRELVLDAYCGVGTIALYMAQRARRVVGLEIIPGAVADARTNARLNNMTNVDFKQGAVERELPKLAARGFKPDLVVLDPPRRGCHEQVLKTLGEISVPKILYISCDPGTMARDAGRLSAMGYGIKEVYPVDMFPHTAHVECVILIQRCVQREK